MASFLVAGSAGAAVINGQFVPDTLVGKKDANGDYVKYRLIFVTSATRDGASSDISAYNGFLNTQVAGTMLDDSTGIYNWQAVMSTFGPNGKVSAASQVRSSSVTTGEYWGIWNTAGQVGQWVANNESALLSAAMVPLTNAITYDQNGNMLSPGASDLRVWTGSNADGSPIAQTGVPNLTVGSTYGQSELGIANAVDGTWLKLAPDSNGAAATASVYAHVYGISGELSAIPEPASLVMWSIAAGVAGIAVWRKRRGSR
jgi:hypothetical protein